MPSPCNHVLGKQCWQWINFTLFVSWLIFHDKWSGLTSLQLRISEVLFAPSCNHEKLCSVYAFFFPQIWIHASLYELKSKHLIVIWLGCLSHSYLYAPRRRFTTLDRMGSWIPDPEPERRVLTMLNRAKVRDYVGIAFVYVFSPTLMS